MYISKGNKGPRWLYIGLLVLEFALTLPGLVLTALASPDSYRTDLWSDGSANGFNSSPKARLYALANYRSYTTPLVWSQFITDWNLIIYVLSVLALLIKAFLFIVDGLWPVLSIPAHAALLAIFAYSTYGQAGPDTSDPDHLQSGAPWYLTKSCSVAVDKKNVSPCKQAKAIFGVTVVMLSIFAIHLALALYSAVPTKAQRITHKDKRRIAREKAAALAESEAASRYNKFHSQWGHNPYAVDPEAAGQTVPYTPGTTGGIKSPVFAHGYPVETPRTLAFNTLGGMAGTPHAATAAMAQQQAQAQAAALAQQEAMQQQQQQQQQQQAAMQSPHSPPPQAQVQAQYTSPPHSPPPQQQPQPTSSPQPYPYPYLNHTPLHSQSPPQPSRDLPLRNHFSTPQPPSSPTGRRSISAASGQGQGGAGGPDGYAPMYFPPPPKKAVK